MTLEIALMIVVFSIVIVGGIDRLLLIALAANFFVLLKKA